MWLGFLTTSSLYYCSCIMAIGSLPTHQQLMQDTLFSDSFLTTFRNLVRHRKPVSWLTLGFLSLLGLGPCCLLVAYNQKTILIIVDGQLWLLQTTSNLSCQKRSEILLGGCWLDGQFWDHVSLGCYHEASWQKSKNILIHPNTDDSYYTPPPPGDIIPKT